VKKCLLYVTPLTLLLLLIGCATENCGDPRFDSLGCAVLGNVSGRYADDTESLRQQALSLRLYAESLRAEAERAQAESATLQGQARTASARLQRLNNEMAGSAERLARLQESQKISADQGRQLQNELAAIERQRSAINLNESDAALVAEIELLEARNRELNAHIDTL
jgi:chromosome segregation ATPase